MAMTRIQWADQTRQGERVLTNETGKKRGPHSAKGNIACDALKRVCKALVVDKS